MIYRYVVSAPPMHQAPSSKANVRFYPVNFRVSWDLQWFENFSGNFVLNPVGLLLSWRIYWEYLREFNNLSSGEKVPDIKQKKTTVINKNVTLLTKYMTDKCYLLSSYHDAKFFNKMSHVSSISTILWYYWKNSEPKATLET